MRRRYIVTIITALVIAAYLNLDEKQDNIKIKEAAIQSEPDYIIQGLSLESYGSKGKLNQQIESDTASHSPHNDTVSFTQPRLILRQGSIPQWGVTSTTGKLIKDQLLILNGNVQIVPMQENAGEFSLSTEQLNIDLQKHIADTDTLVVIESPLTTLQSVGMQMNLKDQVTRLKSQVRGLHVPSQ